MRRTVLDRFLYLCVLSGCGTDDRSGLVRIPEAATARVVLWAPIRGERDLCPATEIRPLRGETHSHALQCAVIARAWTAVEARADVRAVVNLDGNARPVRAGLYFFRLPDLSRTSNPAPTKTYWQVNFPSEADTVGISVMVDSVTGATNLFADNMYGAPFVELLHPRAPDR